ncbi:MAG: molybdopterin-synthase adenylyltransferase MoeB [Chloroflexi bacterium]|nr:molybdopterin-synthase adenylyltransferase MoeB [Chloroflexota bacterium]MDA8187465.1 molybdopterin-synthase adenylyltransferase MoeB [Dehalococcoidales bacterium]
MPVTVYIPTPLRRYTENQARVSTEANDVASLLDDLVSRYPELKTHILDDNYEIPRYVNVYVNEEEIHSLQGKGTRLKDGDQVAVIPAMAGGAQPFSEDQIKRYSRHIILPEVGGKGQRKLLEAKVLLIGTGGLGSPAALYLAAAGVGTLGVVDFDVVDMSNLQRQVIHHVHDLGRPKVQSAAETINDINPDVKVIQHNTRVASDNILDIIADYDVILDGCDNFPTRYLVNDACVLAGKPNVYGSIFRFDGQATVFAPGKGCYRCLFPTPPPPGMVPSCQEAGVLGVLPGIIGVIQATEAVKLILNAGEPLINRLLLYDALSMEFREVKIRRDANCPICGDNPTIKELIDYEQFCGIGPATH